MLLIVKESDYVMVYEFTKYPDGTLVVFSGKLYRWGNKRIQGNCRKRSTSIL